MSMTKIAPHRITLNMEAPLLRALQNEVRLTWVKDNLFALALAEERSVLHAMQERVSNSLTQHQLDVEATIEALELAMESLAMNIDNEPGSTAVLISFDFAFKSGNYDNSNEFCRIELDDRLLSMLYVCAHMRRFGHLGVTEKEVLETDCPLLEELDSNLRILDWSAAETKVYFKAERG